MVSNRNKAILTVSFGTSYEATRKVTIEAIESDIEKAFPDCRVYRAWTSRRIISKVKKCCGLIVPTVKEAMEQMAEDGITDVVVQPTHVIDGIENEAMREDVLSCKDRFASVSFGRPLLSCKTDSEKVIRAVADRFSALWEDTALVLMGHGTTHHANSVYAGLDRDFKRMGYPRIYLGTVEAYPGIDDLIETVGASGVRKVTLAPFMIVAGDHAINDMAGEEPDSWASRFRKAGYGVSVVLEGLGEYPDIRRIFVEHTGNAWKETVL